MTVPTNFDLRTNIRKWVGYKVVTVIQENGVRCVAFIDYGSYEVSKEEGPDLSAQNWKIYYDIVDDGKLDERDDISIDKRNKYRQNEEVRKSWKKHNGNQLTQFRMDRIIEPEAKFLSARRISVKGFDDIIGTHL